MMLEDFKKTGQILDEHIFILQFSSDPIILYSTNKNRCHITAPTFPFPEQEIVPNQQRKLKGEMGWGVLMLKIQTLRAELCLNIYFPVLLMFLTISAGGKEV